MAKIIVNGGDLVWEGKRGRGGHVMYILQWLEGLRRLGFEVLYHDRANGETDAVELFSETMQRWWQPGLSAAVLPSGDAAYGLNGLEVERFAKDAVAIISLGCTFSPEPEPWLASVRPRVLIDQDPGFSQVWVGDGAPVSIYGHHDFYFSVGCNVGRANCALPDFGITWQPIWNPVIIDWWTPTEIVRDQFTTIGGWWGEGYQEFGGRLWGPKAEQMRKFVDLPELLGEELEIVMETAPGDPEIMFLKSRGWSVEAPEAMVADPEAYRKYVSASAGEFSCAKGLYVGTRCGWFSDRSSCFLAAGRPVVLQDTGFGDVLPVGAGLFAVSTVEEAAAAIRTIRADYERHSSAARELALACFDSDRLLSGLLTEIGVR